MHLILSSWYSYLRVKLWRRGLNFWKKIACLSLSCIFIVIRKDVFLFFLFCCSSWLGLRGDWGVSVSWYFIRDIIISITSQVDSDLKVFRIPVYNWNWLFLVTSYANTLLTNICRQRLKLLCVFLLPHQTLHSSSFSSLILFVIVSSSIV
jgi:hypothetical protein